MKRTRDKKMLINFIFFAVAMVSIALLYLLSGISPIRGVVFLAITTASQLGGGTVMNLIAIDFAKFGKSASVMGILNFSVFFGTAAASYLFGFIAESWGWDATIISWIIFAVLGGVVSLLIAPRWNRFKREMLS